MKKLVMFKNRINLFLLFLLLSKSFLVEIKPVFSSPVGRPSLILQTFAINDSLLKKNRKDSSAIKVALDSLRKRGNSFAEFTPKADSLKQVIAARQQKALGFLKSNSKERSSAMDQLQEVPESITLPEAQVPKVTTEISLNLPDVVPPVPGLNTIQFGLPVTPLPSTHGLSNLSKPTNPSGQANNLVTQGTKDFFSGHHKELNEARRQLSRFSSRIDTIKDLRELKGKYLILNPLKDKPWQERVIIGSLWQFSNQQQYHIDLGPSLAWRITDLFAAGGGFQYRLSVSIKHSPWINSADKVYGYHGFFDGQIKKGFFGRLQYEDLSTLVPRPDQATQAEMHTQQWVKGFSVGLGKTYTFYKKINGYSLVQYNLMHKYGETPYLRPLQAKVGFFINGNHLIKAKQKKEQAKGK